MRFQNRDAAARALGDALAAYRGRRPLILAIPRGAVSMGRAIADALDGELDVVLVRKLGAPNHEEFALGSVDEFGASYIAPYAAEAGADANYLQREIAAQRAVMA